MARTELHNRRRDIAAAKVFDVLVDSTCPVEVLAAAKDIQDRADGKPSARQEITEPASAPLLDYLNSQASISVAPPSHAVGSKDAGGK